MTRIVEVKTHPVSLPRPEPVWTAHEELKAWSVILTEIRTDDGLVGYGLIHGSPVPRICEWVERFGEIIHGMDALAHEAVWNKLCALTSPRPGAIEGRDGQMRPVPRGDRTAVWRRSPASTSRCGTSRARPRGCRCTACSAARTGRSSPMRPAAITDRARRTRSMPRSWRGFS